MSDVFFLIRVQSRLFLRKSIFFVVKKTKGYSEARKPGGVQRCVIIERALAKNFSPSPGARTAGSAGTSGSRFTTEHSQV